MRAMQETLIVNLSDADFRILKNLLELLLNEETKPVISINLHEKLVELDVKGTENRLIMFFTKRW